MVSFWPQLPPILESLQKLSQNSFMTLIIEKTWFIPKIQQL